MSCDWTEVASGVECALRKLLDEHEASPAERRERIAERVLGHVWLSRALLMAADKVASSDLSVDDIARTALHAADALIAELDSTDTETPR